MHARDVDRPPILCQLRRILADPWCTCGKRKLSFDDGKLPPHTGIACRVCVRSGRVPRGRVGAGALVIRGT
eukprot:13338746-Heterocapsa_arctica.AAC.1